MMRRRPAAIAAIVLAAATMLLAWSQPWFELVVQGEPLTIGGDLAAGAVLAIALALLAVAGVLAIAGVGLRRVLGAVVALVGVGAVAAAVAVLADPHELFERVVAERTGIGGTGALDLVESAAATVWPVLAIVAGLAAAALGVGVIVGSRHWPASGRRYERGTGAAAAATGDPIEAWDSISRGDDPTDAHAAPPPTDRIASSDDQETERP